MMELIGVSKKAAVEPHAVKDPNTGELLVANADIRKATLAYCVDNLKNRTPEPDAEGYIIAQKAFVWKN
jgi:hypothetical protein